MLKRARRGATHTNSHTLTYKCFTLIQTFVVIIALYAAPAPSPRLSDPSPSNAIVVVVIVAES